MSYEFHKLPNALPVTGDEYIGISQNKAPKKITLDELAIFTGGGGGGGTAGAVKYMGTWNATTNIVTSSDITLNGNPVPAAVPGNEGYYFKVATSGTTTVDGISSWVADDWIVSTGATWLKINNSGGVVPDADATTKGILKLTNELGGTAALPTISNAAVIAKVLTGYTIGSGAVSSSDNILQAIQKLAGTDAQLALQIGTAQVGNNIFNALNFR